MAEDGSEAKNMLTPGNAAAAALCGHLGHLVKVAEHIAGAVNIADPAHHIPVIQLAVEQIADNALR